MLEQEHDFALHLELCFCLLLLCECKLSFLLLQLKLQPVILEHERIKVFLQLLHLTVQLMDDHLPFLSDLAIFTIIIRICNVVTRITGSLLGDTLKLLHNITLLCPSCPTRIYQHRIFILVIIGGQIRQFEFPLGLRVALRHAD